MKAKPHLDDHENTTLMDKVRTALAYELDLPTLFRTVVESIAESSEYELVSLFIKRNDELVLQHQEGYQRLIESLSVNQGVSGRVIRTGKPVFLDDVNTDPDYVRAIENVTSEICIPLFENEKVVGILNVEKTGEIRLTEDDLRLMVALGEHINIAIGRARINDDLRRNNRILSALQTSTLSLMKQLELSEVLQEILSQSSQLLGTKDGYIYVVEPTGDELKVILGLGIFSKYIGNKLKLGEGLAGKVWQSGQAINVQDYYAWEGSSGQFSGTEFRAVVGVPLTSASGVVGVLGLAHLDTGRVFPDEDVELLGRFAQLASIAFENARLYTQAQQELADRRMAEEALRNSETRYRAIFQTSGVSIWEEDYSSIITMLDGLRLQGITDFRGYISDHPEFVQKALGELKVIDVNEMTLDLYGAKSKDELLGSLDKIFVPETLSAFKDELIVLTEGKTYFEGEVIDRALTGETLHPWRTIVFPSEKDEFKSVLVCLTDITARKQAENTLQQSEERMRLIMHSALDAVITMDTKGIVTEWNPQAEAMFGWTHAEAVGEKLTSLIIPHDLRTAHEQGLEKYLKTGDGPVLGKRFEINGLHRSGTIFPLELTITPISAGMSLTFTGFLRDITEPKRIENTLRDGEARLNEAQRIAKTGSWIWEPPDRLTWSENMFALFEMPANEPPTFEKFLEKVLDIDRERVMDGFQAFIASTRIHDDVEYRITGANGEIKTIRAIGHIERDENGAAIKMVGTVQDITESKQANKRIKRQISQLEALRSIDMTITASTDLKLTLREILKRGVAQLKIDAIDILLLDPTTHILEYSDGLGFHTKEIERTKQRVGEGHAGRAVYERKMVNVQNLNIAKKTFSRDELIAKEKFVAYWGMPLIVKGEVKGVLEVFHRRSLEPDSDWMNFFESLAGQTALAIDNATLFDNLRRSNFELVRAYETTLEGWSAALDLRDKETEGHTQRVTALTLQLAQKIELSEKELVHIRRGALLHDIGKMGVPDRILLKPDKLTDDEWEIMRQHPIYAKNLLSSIEYLRPSIDIPYSHHEKWDGTGYPMGLKGEQIPLAARIFAVADVYDALTSDRPYRPAWTKEKTLEHIKSLSGTHFDPKIVDAFLVLLDHV